MTDNTPRPEPMSREQVLAVLDETIAALRFNRFPGHAQSLKLSRAAVAALYERCEALERALQAKHEKLIESECNKIRCCVERDALRRAVSVLAGIPVEDFGKQNKPKYPLMVWNGYELNVQHILDARKALAFTGTEASDAEGGG